MCYKQLANNKVRINVPNSLLGAVGTVKASEERGWKSLVEGAGLPEQRWPLLVCQEQEEGLQGWDALLWILCSGSQKQGRKPR